jgi:signal transduction histidine kinase
MNYFTRLGEYGERAVLRRTDLTCLARHCCTLLEPMTVHRNNALRLRSPDRIAPLQLEPKWLEIALLNLLDNAIKYSFANRWIDVELVERKGVVSIRVINYGMGIPREDWERILEPYYRSEVQDRHVRRGSGIGLAIVKTAVEIIHHGGIHVSSEPLSLEEGADSSDTEGRLHRTVFEILLDRR